ncbi:hypothetical protein O6H91_07G066500 [Diphasiastrum complanatum]|uniref:Uncharacterized protein n=1 Tax=Diphasiastrum complanatum TaxID=34168 RepID=A0ACC2D622_DIPCM|nr:hypothetical protein O6H91_07G066500 [Diphasiastrum complanatum]
MAGEGAGHGGGGGSDYVQNKQRYYQSIHRLTHLKGPYDKVFSVYIPFTVIAISGAMMVRGLYNLSHGIGKKE